MLQPAHAQRHSTLLATGRVWKTHVVSGRQPDQIAISLGSDPARELVWTWRTSPEVESTAIRIVRAPFGDRGKRIPVGSDPPAGEIRHVEGDSTCVQVPSVLNDPIVRRHRVAVDGLEPDTFYLYSLGDGQSRAWGSWKAVKTAPDRGRPVRFLFLGDAQTGLERWGRLLEAAARRHREVDFIIMAGDLVDRGNERTNWDHFFLRAAPVFDRVPVMTCAGNHEYLDVGPRLYRAFFELPHNGPEGIASDLVYSFESGNGCFAVLDSTLAVCDSGAARRQAKWLDGIFERSRATWKLVVFHHPVYPSHPWRDTPALREHWVPVFDKHRVDLVLQGHDHAYLRTYPLRAHRRAEGPGQGTIYVIAVSGDKYVDQARRDYMEVGRRGVSTYQTVDIDAEPDRLTYRAWTEDGRIIDQFRIEKPRERWSVARGQYADRPDRVFPPPATR
jgi:3',5'-cyclic AMP phosphodiesterase CpdA